MPQGSAIDHICFSFILSAFINTVFITCRPRVMTLYSVFEVTFFIYNIYITLHCCLRLTSAANPTVLSIAGTNRWTDTPPFYSMFTAYYANHVTRKRIYKNVLHHYKQQQSTALPIGLIITINQLLLVSKRQINHTDCST